jgi:nucleoside-diphosphate-sugar epimerase
VRGRNSDNRLIAAQLGWEPDAPLRDGMEKVYAWIAGELARRHNQG